MSSAPRAASPPHGFVGGPEHRDALGRLQPPADGAGGDIGGPAPPGASPQAELAGRAVPHEVESVEELGRLLAGGAGLHGLRLQGLDLAGPHAESVRACLLARGRHELGGLVVLGGELDPALEHHLRAAGAVLFPGGHDAPLPVFRARLYTPGELYAGLDEPAGYAGTLDARAYAWYQDARLHEDAYTTLLRAIHDDSMSDALAQALAGRDVVGVMGGHAVQRGTAQYEQAARLGHALAGAGLLVLTGGGPGAMEAANLGAWCRSPEAVDRCLAAVARVPSFRPDVGAWARAGLDATAAERAPAGSVGDPSPAGATGTADGSLRSVGVPTWFYGHEPPGVFCDAVAKLFSNALREDLLLARANAGVVVLPGAAGTVQEIFQLATRLYYAAEGTALPRLVLVGREHWAGTLPVWPLLEALAAGRGMAGALHLVDDVHEAAALLTT